MVNVAENRRQELWISFAILEITLQNVITENGEWFRKTEKIADILLGHIIQLMWQQYRLS